MLADDAEATLAWGARALELATELGDERTRAHALVNIGTARLNMDGTIDPLLEAHAVAEAAGDRHEAARALDNLGYSLFVLGAAGRGAPLRAAGGLIRRRARAADHRVLRRRGDRVASAACRRVGRGRAPDAPRDRERRDRPATSPRRCWPSSRSGAAIRTPPSGSPRSAPRLIGPASRSGSCRSLELAIEWALVTGLPLPTERIEALISGIPPRGRLSSRNAMRVAAWAAVAGIEVDVATPMSPPHAAMVRRDWRAAADAFGEVGWTYDRALLLSLLDDEEALVEAIEIARALGTEPLTRRVTRRLRELGMSVPRGPRESSRANPAGLTARQLEVLSLLADGLTNAEIADRLIVSQRTAEHHVAAVLTKLGAATRRDAARRAVELGHVAHG